jgi:hypothetical protein
MRNAVLAVAAATSLWASCATGVQAQTAPAPQLIFGVDRAGEAPVLDPVQFFWGGRRFCWYVDAWRGPGWYWCGYAWRRGYGWGGGYGWRGWRGGYYGGGYRGGWRGDDRGGGFRHGAAGPRGGHDRAYGGRGGGGHRGGGAGGGHGHHR